MVVLTGRSKKFNSTADEETVDLNDLFKGKCFLRLKSQEFEELEEKVKTLYNKLNPNGTKFFYDKNKSSNEWEDTVLMI